MATGSPFLGEMEAGPFFNRPEQASATNIITPIDIFPSDTRSKDAVGVLPVRLELPDGTVITSKVRTCSLSNPTAIA